MHGTDDRPLLAKARQAADDYLMRKVMAGDMEPGVAENLATIGFTVTTRTLSAMRRDGIGEEQIEAAYGRQLAAAQADRDERRIVAAEYSLAIWGGMLEDLAAYMGGPGAEARR